MSIFPYKYNDNAHKCIHKYEYDGVFHNFWKYDKIRPDKIFFKNMHKYAFVSKSLKVKYVFVGVFKRTYA